MQPTEVILWIHPKNKLLGVRLVRNRQHIAVVLGVDIFNLHPSCCCFCCQPRELAKLTNKIRAHKNKTKTHPHLHLHQQYIKQRRKGDHVRVVNSKKKGTKFVKMTRRGAIRIITLNKPKRSQSPVGAKGNASRCKSRERSEHRSRSRSRSSSRSPPDPSQQRVNRAKEKSPPSDDEEEDEVELRTTHHRAGLRRRHRGVRGESPTSSEPESESGSEPDHHTKNR